MSRFDFYALTHKGDKQDYNEDAIEAFELHDTLFLMVADGQGSHLGGLAASTLAIYEMKTFLEARFQPHMPLEPLLREAFYVAHRVIEGARKGGGGRYQGLCTSLTMVALTAGKRITFAHVGNTKLFLMREGQLIGMTEDQTVAQQLFKDRKINKDEIKHHPERFTVTNAVGVFSAVTPDIRSGSVQQEDLLVLVSDGITEHLNENEMARLIAQGGNCKTASEHLINGANERGGYDNLSAVLSYVNF
ncbi:PP2C family protein-serine/threonine phosphatase [Cytobacillus sp. FJAT-54145]|uniref:PP2C family protein-serine/threonine phosphatase n=1 Tax=Cytobacillus spartinae TaxID=3299023 RepID=A0ABW6KEY4_9BACI